MKRKFDTIVAPFGFCADKEGSLDGPNSNINAIMLVNEAMFYCEQLHQI